MSHRSNSFFIRSLILVLTSLLLSVYVAAQSLSAGTVSGTVVDPNKAVVANATVTIENAVTGDKQAPNTGSDGTFRFDNIPFNNYVYTASASGFGDVRGAVNIRSSVPISVTIPLAVGSATATVTVTSGTSDVLENVPSAHTDVDQSLLNRLPTRSPGSGLSDVI